MSAYAEEACPFCAMAGERVIESDKWAIAITDAYPVSLGHTLIVPRRHVSNFFDLSVSELRSIGRLIHLARQRLDCALAPLGYNIGVNVGRTAGQTIMHAHVHIIPRYPGDVQDPTGGIRNVIPGKGRYK